MNEGWYFYTLSASPSPARQHALAVEHDHSRERHIRHSILGLSVSLCLLVHVQTVADAVEHPMCDVAPHQTLLLGNPAHQNGTYNPSILPALHGSVKPRRGAWYGAGTHQRQLAREVWRARA